MKIIPQGPLEMLRQTCPVFPLTLASEQNLLVVCLLRELFSCLTVWVQPGPFRAKLHPVSGSISVVGLSAGVYTMQVQDQDGQIQSSIILIR